VRPALPLLAILLLSPLAPRPLGAETLSDSTVVDGWTLANGLEVRTRHVPGASGVAIALAYRVGSDSDAAGQSGFAALMAEAAFTGPAGAIPERTRGEMESLRPLGWELRVNPAWTLFLESATPAQLPGVLTQVGTRMREPRVTAASLAAARATVRRDLGERWVGDAARSAHERVRHHARGGGDDAALAAGTARWLDAVKPADAQRWLARWYVPSNAVLALAGDLSTPNLRAMVDHAFGAIPAGTRPAAAVATLDSASVRVVRAGLDAPVAAIGVMAPALTDSIHPGFFLSMLVFGQAAKNRWPQGGGPNGSRFHYSVLDDPQMARFFPQVFVPEDNPEDAARQLKAMVLEVLQFSVVRLEFYQGMVAGLQWLFGGPLPRPLLDTVRRDPAALNQLAFSVAGRAVWGDDAFWAEYRRRLDPTVTSGADDWLEWVTDAAHQSRVVLTPHP
jgi:predicted Zn-dependent peptidase